MTAKQDAAARNRALMPISAQFIQEWRSVFGDCVPLYMKEGDLEYKEPVVRHGKLVSVADMKSLDFQRKGKKK